MEKVSENGVTFIFGSIPMSEIASITDGAPEGSVIDLDLARLAGANLAFGPRENIDKARFLYRKKAESEAEKAADENQYPGLSRKAVKWLLSGEHGSSSMFMFAITTGATLDQVERRSVAWPWDADDFRRCALLWDQVPEVRENLDKMREVNSIWCRLVEQWDDLIELLTQDYPGWRKGIGSSKGRSLYQRIKEIIG